MSEHDEPNSIRWAVSGASGMLGSALRERIAAEGQQCIQLVRPGSPSGGSDETVMWDPSRGELDPAALDGIDVVVHLAGENIAARRWSNEQKRRIRDSRVSGTHLIAEALARMQQPPKVFLCASGVHYYGDRGDAMIDESAGPGTGFLSEVVQAWEAACEPARQAGIRTVNLRFGMIVSSRGGALAKMVRPFKMGAGGRVGTGRQYWSWVHLDDAVGAMFHAVATEDLAGPVNVVVPESLTSETFTTILGRVLHRPTIAPLPAFAARLMLGEMADEMLLSSMNVVPKRLQQSGFQWRFPNLEGALRHELTPEPEAVAGGPASGVIRRP